MQQMPTKEEKPTKVMTLLQNALREEREMITKCDDTIAIAETEKKAAQERLIEIEGAIEALANHRNLAELASRYSVQMTEAAEALVSMMDILEARRDDRMTSTSAMAHLEMLAGRLRIKEREADDVRTGN